MTKGESSRDPTGYLADAILRVLYLSDFMHPMLLSGLSVNAGVRSSQERPFLD